MPPAIACATRPSAVPSGLQPLLDYHLVKLSGLNITVGALLAAALAVVLAWLASVLLRRALKRYGERHANANQAALYTISRLAHYVLLTIGFLLALELAGIPIGKIHRVRRRAWRRPRLRPAGDLQQLRLLD